MTEEDLREIEDRLRASGNKPVRMVIATLSLDVEKLLAEVRRLQAQLPAVCQVRNGPWRCVDVPGHAGQHVWQTEVIVAPEFDPNASGNLDG